MSIQATSNELEKTRNFHPPNHFNNTFNRTQPKSTRPHCKPRHKTIQNPHKTRPSFDSNDIRQFPSTERTPTTIIDAGTRVPFRRSGSYFMAKAIYHVVRSLFARQQCFMLSNPVFGLIRRNKANMDVSCRRRGIRFAFRSYVCVWSARKPDTSF